MGSDYAMNPPQAIWDREEFTDLGDLGLRIEALIEERKQFHVIPVPAAESWVVKTHTGRFR